MDISRIEGEMISGLETSEMDFLSLAMTNGSSGMWNQWTGLPSDVNLNASIGEFRSFL